MRTPSGVSYVLENREIMMRLFPDAFSGQSISPVGNYPERLLENLRAVAPSDDDHPVVVLLTQAATTAPISSMCSSPSRWASSRRGGDLFVRDGYVWMRTTEGPVKIDVIIAGSTMRSWIRSPSMPIRRLACLASCRSSALAEWRSPMPSAPGWPTTRPCIAMCRA